MKNCEAYQERMTAGLAGELSPEEEAELRAHLEKCPACRAEFEELSRTWKLTEAMLEATALDETLPDSNRAEIRRAMNPRRRFPAVRAFWKIAAMFLVCAAVLCVVLLSAPENRRHVRLDVFQSSGEKLESIAALKKSSVPAKGNRAEKPMAPARDQVPAAEAVTLASSAADSPGKAERHAAADVSKSGMASTNMTFKRKTCLLRENNAPVSGTAEETLTLAFGDFPEIGEKEISAVTAFFRKNGIRLEPDEIRLRKESFEIRVSPPRMETIRIFLRKRKPERTLLPAGR